MQARVETVGMVVLSEQGEAMRPVALAGVRVRAGDDIIDASVRGYIRDIIEKLEGT